MAPNEISITHPDGVKKLLLATLPKVNQDFLGEFQRPYF
jgi:hypothetical protein